MGPQTMKTFFPLLLLALPPAAQAAAPEPSGPAVVEELVAQALAVRPELAASQAEVRAAEQQARQAGALPDPMLQLGAQRDQMVEAMGAGEVIVENGTYFSAMVSQPIPFPTKLSGRAAVARTGVDLARAELERLRLSTEADVRRGYLELMLAREQLALLAATEVLWSQSETIARTRYEVGQAPQTDLLRAQLERSRLRQRRLALESRERVALQQLNRLRAQPLDADIPTPVALAKLPEPTLGTLESALEDAQARSPELQTARFGTEQASRSRSLARSELLPDLGVYAGVMPQGSELMWQAGVQVSLPIFAFQKQLPAVKEAEARLEARGHDVEAVLQLLRLRVAERQQALDAVVETNRIFGGGLLVQSEAAANSALGQYQAGQVPFTTVLESLSGLLQDRGSHLDSLAAAQRIVIAAREVSLEPVEALTAAPAAMPAATMGSSGQGARRTGSAGGAPAAAGAASGGSMGGM